MMDRVPLNNALALSEICKITTKNPRTAAGIIIDMNRYHDTQAVGEWLIVGYHKKSRKLLLIPSLTNTLAINKAFKSNVIGQDGDVLTVHSNITKNKSLLFQPFKHEKSIFTLNVDARTARNIKFA